MSAAGDEAPPSGPSLPGGPPSTERPLEASADLDRLPLEEAFDLMDREDRTVAGSVAGARAEILEAVRWVVAALEAGRRLLYVGAGTSGRMGVLDAAECPPTFRSDPAAVLGVLAGGADALVRAVEGAEDSAAAGAEALAAREVRAGDLVIGLSASGRTPFVDGALRAARERGARTVLQTAVRREEAAITADLVIAVPTGPEVLAGSTRLKAGTATKLVLNRISTLAMVRLGKVYRNRMVDLDTHANRKLRARGERMLRELTGLDGREAAALLDRAEGQVKLALCMHARGLDLAAARALLDAANGSLARALGEIP